MKYGNIIISRSYIFELNFLFVVIDSAEAFTIADWVDLHQKLKLNLIRVMSYCDICLVRELIRQIKLQVSLLVFYLFIFLP